MAFCARLRPSGDCWSDFFRECHSVTHFLNCRFYSSLVVVSFGSSGLGGVDFGLVTGLLPGRIGCTFQSLCLKLLSSQTKECRQAAGFASAVDPEAEGLI